MNFPVARMCEFIPRSIFALVALASALPAFRYAEVAALRANAPLEAVQIAPHDAKALANYWGKRFDDNPELKPGAADLADLRNALSAQPLEPRLLSIVGLTYEAFGETKRAQEAMHLANYASRRDGVSGLYLIESGSASGNVNATLKHYNAVLLTQPNLHGALLPILSSAIGFPEIRQELRTYLQAGVKWVPPFLAVVAEKGSVTDLQALLLPLPKTLQSEEYAPILASILHRIAVEGDRVDALRFAVATIPGLSPASLSSLRSDTATLDKRLGQFAWTFPPVDGVQVEADNHNTILIKAEPLARGAVAIRDILLDGASKYQLFQHLQYGPGSVHLDARWSADCISSSGATRFWEQRLPTSGPKGELRSELIVPFNCKLVRMTLFAEGPDGQLPAALEIAGLAISKKLPAIHR